MYLKVARTITFLLILFMSMDIIGASVTALPSTADDHTTIVHSQKSPSSVLTSFLCEKAEEESEKTEDERYSMAGVVLLDFSRLAFSLSFYHTPQVRLAVPAFQYDVRPPVHQLVRVFLI
jgi:hypothetical protein